MFFGIKNQISTWTYVSLITSVLVFITVGYLLCTIKSGKRSTLYGAIISALADLASISIIIAYSRHPSVKINALFFFHGIQYSFAFYIMLYAFRRIINQNKEGDGTFLVYLGYLWMWVTIGLSFAATIILGRDSLISYSYSTLDSLYYIIIIEMYSIWGFIIIILYLYFANNHIVNTKTAYSMMTYILFALIAAVFTTLILNNVIIKGLNGISFFLVELPIRLAVVTGAYYSPSWIENLNDNRDLEGVNMGPNNSVIN